MAHVQEKDDDGRVIKRPMVATRLSEELVIWRDIAGYMTTITILKPWRHTKRLIIADPASGNTSQKDRTGRLDVGTNQTLTKIADGVRGDAEYDA